MSTLATNLFETDQTIFYYNKWRGFENKEIRDIFRHLDKEEKDSLKVGDMVWMDKDPYYHHGKVYGFTLVKITEENLENMQHLSYKLYLVTEGKEDRLAELTREEEFSLKIM